MYKFYYITLLAVFMFACKGETKELKLNENNLFGEVKLMRKLHARTEKEIENMVIDKNEVDIKDVFLLLPDNIFPVEEIGKDKRKLLLQHIGEDDAFNISSTPIGVCDVKNGYLNLTGLQYDWEMCYWNLKDGGKLVAINNSTETGSIIRVFFYNNGKLTEDFNYKLGGNQNYKLIDFIDVSQLLPESIEYAEQQFANGAYRVYYQLPQNGTSITIDIDIDDLIDKDENYDVFYEASKHVMLHWKNEKWER